MAQFFLFDHPLIQHKISMLRDKNTSTKDFRELVSEISMLMAYEVTRDFELEDIEVETPICKCMTKVLSHKRKITLVPVLRAGLGMVDGMLKILPSLFFHNHSIYEKSFAVYPSVFYYIHVIAPAKSVYEKCMKYCHPGQINVKRHIYDRLEVVLELLIQTISESETEPVFTFVRVVLEPMNPGFYHFSENCFIRNAGNFYVLPIKFLLHIEFLPL